MSQTTPTVPPIANKIMKFMLTSSLHGVVDKTILLVSFTGRKTGKTYSTPVSYSQSGDQVTIFTHANWWKNLEDGKPVTLRLRGKDVQGLPEPVAGNKQAIATGLVDHLRKVPSDASYYKVTFDENRNPIIDDVEKAVQNVVMIRFRLC